MPSTPLHSHQPSHSWESIEALYSSLLEHGWDVDVMMQIVKYLRQPAIEASLFGLTSLHRLYLAQTKMICWGANVLKIEPIVSLKSVEFTYFDDTLYPPEPAGSTRSPRKPWRTMCPNEDAVERLERILFRRLRWFRRDNEVSTTNPQML